MIFSVCDRSLPELCVRLLRVVLILVAIDFPLTLSAINASYRYRSPRNPERKVRTSTRLIVLHTTEAPARSSLNKLSDRGEAHYCVTEDGGIYVIVDRDREAFHAGRSLWTGVEDVDKYSIGIECVGYHNKAMPMVQLVAIRSLVKELQSMYRIPDERVVAHSHVAYGVPNRWQKRRHRGRKRCGMLFAMPSVRRVLQLKSRPAYDPDTRAGRLVVGDPYLNKILYGRTDTLVAAYSGKSTNVTAPSKNWFSKLLTKGKTSPPKSNQTTVQKPVARATKVKPKTTVKASRAPRNIAELKARGYVQKGTVSKSMTASKIAGKKWNAADTYYTIRNKVIPGNTLDDARIEKGMAVWMRK